MLKLLLLAALILCSLLSTALAEEDMQNRKEQTELLLSTMKHFGYENYDLVVRPGKHVKYLRRNNEEGVNEFADMVYDFICSVEEEA